ncbi:DUF2087 domain-containing protein [Halovenus rubra]|uniref:DUF2087 domain-containing protein n=2 Tax=Halovenus rubra TaxID=869890 RepID=A0ABD5XCC7_9EURY|nr:DUF2087 domain-containing protein [Halovenus rubra]
MDINYDRDPESFYQSCLERARLPRNDALKQIILERLAEKFERGDTYQKNEVTETLESHFDDPVLVRRELVNFGYLRYDNTQNTYRLHKTKLSEQDYRENSRLERHATDLGLLE